MGAQKVKLTDNRVETWAPPKDGKEHYLWDTETTGLCVRAVRDARTFYLYRWVAGKPKRLRIGSVGEVLLARAREVACAWNADLHAGRPLTPLGSVAASDRGPNARTLGAVFADYIEAVKGDKTTWEQDQAFFDRFLKAHAHVEFDEIDRAFVTARYTEVRDGKIPRRWRNGTAPKGWKQRPTKVQAARFVTLLGSVIKWEWKRRVLSGEHTGNIPDSPTKGFLGLMGHKENKTYADSHLPQSEFDAIVAAIDAHEKAGGNRVRCDALRLMAWTGLRKSNVLRLQWEWINLNATRPYIEIPKGEFKGKREHIVPLIPQAAALLRRWRKSDPKAKYVLPGRAEDGHVGDLRPSWVKVLELAGLAERRPRVRMHDVRGHVATKLHRMGVPVGTIMAIMGWKNVQTAMRYIRASRDEAFDAMEKYGEAWGKGTLKLADEEAA
ncbi:MAG: site-specific integrase [Phycisphaerales bacterium]|nr:site-specific integrase [Phycisphaerales bacterium]